MAKKTESVESEQPKKLRKSEVKALIGKNVYTAQDGKFFDYEVQKVVGNTVHVWDRREKRVHGFAKSSFNRHYFQTKAEAASSEYGRIEKHLRAVHKMQAVYAKEAGIEMDKKDQGNFFTRKFLGGFIQGL